MYVYNFSLYFRGRNRSEAQASIWNCQTAEWTLGHRNVVSLLALWFCTLPSREHCACLRPAAHESLLPCTEAPRGSLEVHLDFSKAFHWPGFVCELPDPL